MSVESETIHTRMPLTATQLTGHATGLAVEGLTGRSPWMLGIVLLNLVGVAAAVYFLNLLISGQQAHLKALLDVQDKQQSEIIEMHKKEFDALLAMAQREPIPPTVQPSVPVTPLPQGRR
jgi:hypothetical protein